GTGSVPIISKCAWDSIALSARAKPSLTCCASPQKTIMEFAQGGANDRCLERRNPVAGGTTSRPTSLRWTLPDIGRFHSFTELSSNRRLFVHPLFSYDPLAAEAGHRWLRPARRVSSRSGCPRAILRSNRHPVL